MKYYLVAVLLFSIVHYSHSQEKWTLERCINYAMENNLQIKQQELFTKINHNNLESSKAGILPSLNAGSNQNFTFGRSVDPFTNEFSTDNVSASNASLSSSVVLFSGLQQFYNVKRHQTDYRVGLLDLEQAKNNIMLMIVSAYLNVLYNIELREIAQNQVEITELQVERIRKLVKSGSLPLQNQYELEAQLSNEELNLVNLENSLNISLLNLAQILEIDDVENFDIVKPDIKDIPLDAVLLSINQIYNEAMGRMPQIESANLQIESAYYNLLIAKGARLPRLTLNASYGTGYSTARKEIDQIIIGEPQIAGFVVDEFQQHLFDVYQYSFDYSYATRPFSDQIRDNASASISLGLSIPIFNGWQTRTNISNSHLRYKQTKLQARQIEKDLLQEIQQAHADASAAIKKYHATEKTLEAMQLSFNYTQQRFDLGLLNSVDFNIAKNNLTRTESELVRAKYDFIFRQKILDFYRGVRITL